jgi:hypothetical protein
MTITYPLAMPSRPTLRSVSPAPFETVGGARSPFTQQAQKQRHDGQLWVFKCELPPLRRDLAAPWIAWRLALAGSYGSFLFGDPTGRTPLGVATGTPLADSVGSPAINMTRDEVLYTKGWTAGVTGILKAGSYLQVGTGLDAHLHMVTRDANSDGSGRAVLDIWPRLRGVVVDGAAITINSAQGLFEMAGNEMPWDVGLAHIYGLSFTAIERLPS